MTRLIAPSGVLATLVFPVRSYLPLLFLSNKVKVTHLFPFYLD